MCVCECNTCRGHKRALYTQELKLLAVLSVDVGVGN